MTAFKAPIGIVTRVPIVIQNEFKMPMAAPADITVTIDNPVAGNVALSPDNTHVQITGLAAGAATVVVMAGGKTATLAVEFVGPAVDTITLEPDRATLPGVSLSRRLAD